MFVHGTGVRQPAYDVAFERFAAKVAPIRPGYDVVPCYWGGPCGSRLSAGGVCIPSGRTHRAPGGQYGPAAADEDAEIALWELLERDPLFELRLLSTTRASQEELPPNALPPGRELAGKAEHLPEHETVMARATLAGLDGVLPRSIEAILGSSVTGDALRQEPSLGDALRTSLARALVADALRRADEELGDLLPLDGAHRDALIASIADALGGTDRGIGSAFTRFGLDIALALGITRPLERRRSAITEATAAPSGDVLMYLARGDRIRDFIAQMISTIRGPVVLLAHSLGGIASLELLAAKPMPSVDMLITVGSQAPFLYELNALPTLPFGGQLPRTVPPWVNIFDRRDLLAFTGSAVFPGQVEDREVDCRAPFPRSHSAYFASDRFYSVLDEVLP